MERVLGRLQGVDMRSKRLQHATTHCRLWVKRLHWQAHMLLYSACCCQHGLYRYGIRSVEARPHRVQQIEVLLLGCSYIARKRSTDERRKGIWQCVTDDRHHSVAPEQRYRKRHLVVAGIHSKSLRAAVQNISNLLQIA